MNGTHGTQSLYFLYVDLAIRYIENLKFLYCIVLEKHYYINANLSNKHCLKARRKLLLLPCIKKRYQASYYYSYIKSKTVPIKLK